MIGVVLSAALLASGGTVWTLHRGGGMAICQDLSVKQTKYANDGAARAKILGSLPPADHIVTVLRSENGCSNPVIVRQDIGQPQRGK